MALQPVTASADDPGSPELADMTRRFWWALALGVPVLILEMGGECLPIPPGISAWLQCVLATPVVLWAGLRFFHRAWTSVVNRSLNMFSLIALGTGTA